MLKLRQTLKELINKRSLSPKMMSKIRKSSMFQVPEGMSQESFNRAFYSEKTSDSIRYAALLSSLTGHGDKFNLTLRSYNRNNSYFVQPKFRFVGESMEVSHFVLAGVSHIYDPVARRKSKISGDFGGKFKLTKQGEHAWSTQTTPNISGARPEDAVENVEGTLLDRHTSWDPGTVKELKVDAEVEQIIEAMPIDSLTTHVIASALESGTDLSLVVDMLQWVIAAIQFLKTVMAAIKDNILWLDFDRKYYASGDPRINRAPTEDEVNIQTGQRMIGDIKGGEFEDFIQIGQGLMPAWEYADALPEWSRLYARFVKISVLKNEMRQRWYYQGEWEQEIYSLIHELVLTMEPAIDLAEKMFSIDWKKAIVDPNISSMSIPKIKHLPQDAVEVSQTADLQNFANYRSVFEQFVIIGDPLHFQRDDEE